MPGFVLTDGWPVQPARCSADHTRQRLLGLNNNTALDGMATLLIQLAGGGCQPPRVMAHSRQARQIDAETNK